MTRLASILLSATLLSATPAMACPECPQEPPPETPQAPPPVTVPPDSDNDPAPFTPQPIWMPCARDGEVILIHVEAWLRLLHGKAEAERITIGYCISLPLDAIPEAKAWRKE